MIKLAVIDNRVESSNNQIHRLDNDGPIQTVDSFDYQQDILDSNDAKEKRVIVFNIQLNGNEGVELIKQIKNKQATVCILLSTDDNEAINQEQVLAGADLIIHKDNLNNSLIKEINQVLSDGKPINPKVTNRIIKFISHPQIKHWEDTILLTNREIEIMNLLIKGFQYKEIAKKLSISLQTVKNHLKKIYIKFHVNNRTEAILKYTR